MNKKILLQLGTVAITTAPMISCFGGSGQSPAAYGSYEGEAAVRSLLEHLGYKTNTIDYQIGYSYGAAKDKITEKVTAKNYFVMTTGHYKPDQDIWSDDARTYTVAKDGIVINAKLPIGIKIKNDERPLFDASELIKLMDSDSTNKPTWMQLLLNETDDSSQESLAKIPTFLTYKETENIKILYYNEFVDTLEKIYNDRDLKISFDEDVEESVSVGNNTHTIAKDLHDKPTLNGIVTLNLHSTLKLFGDELQGHKEPTTSTSLIGDIKIKDAIYSATGQSLTDNQYPFITPLNMIIYLDKKENKDYKWLANEFFSPVMQEKLYMKHGLGKMKGNEIDVQFGKSYANGNTTFRTDYSKSDKEIHAIPSTRNDYHYGLINFTKDLIDSIS